MLLKFLALKSLGSVQNQALRLINIKAEPCSFVDKQKIKSSLVWGTYLPVQHCRTIYMSSFLSKVEDRREMLASMPAKDEGTEGEKTVDIDTLIKRAGDGLFPDETTSKQLFNGTPFEELPIFNIKVSPNNTIISVTDHKGVVKLMRSCGVEGFKNTRKGTNVAAQATAISLSMKALEYGYKTVRVRVRGLGPGRMAAIKGLQMGGMDIVSITDSTPVSWNPPRPRKQKKL
ncbi:28S ribosomal protein S11, mitochondrial [Schistocerca americana]|uniref:28S ribosomal protein S11, mitochondrial n=1 Tax=Schistocerca americana TaxID=7009 RepID=UPI001F4F5801|nr:28S ribosomal protein S11, mitochondrial [Schistocerca americana]